METITVGNFTIVVKHTGYEISRETNSTEFRPGEEASAINVMKHALSTEKLKILPPYVKHMPFQVNFTPERVMYLKRQDDKGNGVAFKFGEGDDLVNAIKQGVLKLKDINTVEKRPGNKRHAGMQTPDPVIIGR